jgi:macrodomain Ter protein organizer (MatP/YcbG family)
VDTKKYKSVALRIDVYDKVKKMSEENDRTISGTVSHLTKLAEADKEKALRRG